MQRASHPLWLAGFRPFFALACLAGALLPPLWALIYGGRLALPHAAFGPLQWHAHEMFFGFGWAVLGGFLLTSTKNWVNVRGYHGPALALLALAWLVERLAVSFGGDWPPVLRLAGTYLFLSAIGLMLAWTLIRHRERDSYRDNAFFIVMLPTFLVAKTQLLFGDFASGYSMSLALFRLAFLIMLERTLTQFMRAAFQVEILRRPWLDMPIKLLGLMLVFQFALPAVLGALLSLGLALLLGLRLLFWQPQRALRRIDIGIMYVGYLCIVGQLLVDGLARFIDQVWVGAFAVHLFSFGAMGCVIPAMIVRIAKGHTGRKVVFDGLDKAALYLMLLGLAVRIGLPQWFPAAYLRWIELAAACWTLAFGSLALRYIPMLMRPRVDGREH